MRKLELFNSVEYPKSVIITGACRSGKTTLCKLWASMQGVEWIEEPISLSLITQCADMYVDSNGLYGIAPELYNQMWGLEYKEIVNDLILCRTGVNLRPHDLSSAWDFKRPEDIFDRLLHINNRVEVREYIKKHNSLFLVDIPELISALSLLEKEVLGYKMIYLVRTPENVALETVNKGWFSDENMINPLKGNDCSYLFEYDNVSYRLPFWVKEKDAEVFVKSPEYVRGLIYWISIAELGILHRADIDMIIKYEDIVSDPYKFISELADEVGGKITERTETICSELKNRRDCSGEVSSDCDIIRSENKIPKNVVDRFNACKEYFGY